MKYIWHIVQMKRHKRYFLIILLLISSIGYSSYAQSTKISKRIVILGLDTTQFYSDAFYLDSLKKFYDTDASSIPRLFGSVLLLEINNYEYDNFIYSSIPRSHVDSVRSVMNYSTLTNRLGDDYLGIVPRSRDQSVLERLIQRTDADYILSLNLYELLALKDSTVFGDSVRHVIHFDLLDKNLKTVNAGRFDMDTDQYNLYDLNWFYKDFALDQIFWIKAYEKDPQDLESEYYQEIDNFFKKGTSIAKMKLVGLNLGTGMPYGGVGIFFGKVFSENWEWNLGAGFDFKGISMGFGFKNYILGTHGLGPRPFVALHLSSAFGNEFKLGGEKDEFGNQLFPDDVTRFKISADQAIHLSFGMNFLTSEGIGINPSIGYAFPFKRKDIEILSGPDKTGRTNFVKFNAVGGIQFGATFIFYQNY